MVAKAEPNPKGSTHLLLGRLTLLGHKIWTVAEISPNELPHCHSQCPGMPGQPGVYPQLQAYSNMGPIYHHTVVQNLDFSAH